MCFLKTYYCSSVLSFINQLFIFEGVLDHYIGDEVSNILTTMSSVGKIELFDPTQETFSCYVKRIKNFFSANEVADAKQKYVFLNSLGRKHYNLLSNLLSPAEPEDKSLDELITVLTKHFQPTTSVILVSLPLSDP